MKAKKIFNEGDTSCDTTLLKERVDFFVIQQSLWLAVFGLLLIGILSLLLGYTNASLEEITRQLVFYLCSLLFCLKFIWFVLFAVAYKQQVPNCLVEQYEIFAEAYVFLKPLFIIESLLWGYVTVAIICFIIGFPIVLCLSYSRWNRSRRQRQPNE